MAPTTSERPDSKVWESVVTDLLAIPPENRVNILLTLEAVEQTAVLNACHHHLGTRWGLWWDDPVGFCRYALGETLWSAQRDILVSVASNERTAVPAGHSLGKSHIAARAVAWWVATNPPGASLALTTSDKWRKVRNNLWPHIRRVHKRGQLLGKCLQTEWQIGDLAEPVAFGFSPAHTDSDAFSGIHAPRMLVVVDEGGAVTPQLGESLESLMSSAGARMLVIGNPPIDDTGSPWFEQRCQSPHYHVIPLPASTSPNLTGEVTDLCASHPGLPPHPISDHLPTAHSIDVVRDEYGEESPYYQARVLALFPKNIPARVIPRSWVDDAAANETPEASRWVRLGVDVAADGGDELAIARADGHLLRIVHHSAGSVNENPLDVAGMILEQILEAEQVAAELGSQRQVRVKIDALGIGWGVAGTLQAWGSEGRHRSEIVAVEVSRRCNTSEGQERFSNQRAEMWWCGRDAVKPGPGQGPPRVALNVDDKTCRQLSAPGYGHDSSGRILIESKDKMKKRGVESPDRAEAILLALFEPGTYVEESAGADIAALRIPDVLS